MQIVTKAQEACLRHLAQFGTEGTTTIPNRTVARRMVDELYAESFKNAAGQLRIRITDRGVAAMEGEVY